MFPAGCTAWGRTCLRRTPICTFCLRATQSGATWRPTSWTSPRPACPPTGRGPLGTFREHWVHIQGTLSAHSGNIKSTFREHSVHILPLGDTEWSHLKADILDLASPRVWQDCLVSASWCIILLLITLCGFVPPGPPLRGWADPTSASAPRPCTSVINR
jgi:hypothetical protein